MEDLFKEPPNIYAKDVPNRKEYTLQGGNETPEEQTNTQRFFITQNKIVSEQQKGRLNKENT